MIGGLLLAAGLLLSSCAGSAAAPATPAAAPAPATVAPVAGAGETVVKTTATPLGTILTDAHGLTLYGFTNDTKATSTCFSTCADAWPPVLVSEDWIVGPGLDSGVFSTIIRTDGQRQLMAGKWPLYTFAGDAVPGDTNGQGSGDVWFVVGADAKLVETGGPASAATTTTTPASATAPVTTASTSLGNALVDAEGRTLYGFTKDANGTPTCVDGCATAWPPALVPSDQLPAGLDAAVFSVVARPDGTHQLEAGTWPLYRFAGDDKAGDVNGQGSGGNWFVAAPDGTLIKGGGAAKAAPAPAPAPAPVPAPTTPAPAGRGGY